MSDQAKERVLILVHDAKVQFVRLWFTDILGRVKSFAITESELVRKAFGAHIFNRFIELKRAEWEEYRIQLTPYETRKYLPIL